MPIYLERRFTGFLRGDQQLQPDALYFNRGSSISHPIIYRNIDGNTLASPGYRTLVAEQINTGELRGVYWTPDRPRRQSLLSRITQKLNAWQYVQFP